MKVMPRKKSRAGRFVSRAKAKTHRIVHHVTHFRHRRAKPSVLKVLGIAAPQWITMNGQMGGYDALTPALSGDYKGAIDAALANEIKMWLAYDVGTKKLDFSSALFNYGSIFATDFVHKKWGHKIKVWGRWTV